MNARYYLPAIGRFLTPDTLVPDPANPQSFNRYSYVLNNPLKYSDPTGHSPVCEIMPEECQSSTTALVSFDVANGVDETWTGAEMSAIYQGAYDVAVALARDINAYTRGLDLTRFGEEYQDITPEEAFQSVYGGTVTFRKTGQSCAEATTATSCYAQTQSSRLIHVFTDIYDEGVSKIPRPNNSNRWAVHELAHAFESRVNGVLGNEFVRNQLPDNVLNRNGFAGPFNGWQQSQSNGRGEIFADMFIGWTYGQWATDPNTGALTNDAVLKNNFMSINMSVWIAVADR